MNQSNSELTFSLPMSTQDIEKCIPHRYPFLLVDRVTDYKPGEFIVAYKNISGTDPVLQGHFPGNPLMPGVLMVEGMAQASAVLGKLTHPETSDTCLLMEIGETRFRRMVVPGDCLEYHVRVVKKRQHFFWFEAEAKVGDEIAATAKFSAKLA